MTQPKHRPLELASFFAFSGVLSLCLGFTATIQSTSLKVSDTPIFQFNWLQAIVLGMVQGLTEFLPISSTAHLKVVPLALGWGDPGVSFIAVIQLGSITAVIWYFWSDLTDIIQGMAKAIYISDYKSYDFQLAAGITLGTLPIVFFGLLWKLLVSDLDNSP
ncbi:MAG: undecaprenyl-diphosphate phosphatase, partial [cyanobacterium endosymbiont of Rhopalodia fuxianensis]